MLYYISLNGILLNCSVAVISANCIIINIDLLNRDWVISIHTHIIFISLCQFARVWLNTFNKVFQILNTKYFNRSISKTSFETLFNFYKNYIKYRKSILTLSTKSISNTKYRSSKLKIFWKVYSMSANCIFS